MEAVQSPKDRGRPVATRLIRFVRVWKCSANFALARKASFNSGNTETYPDSERWGVRMVVLAACLVALAALSLGFYVAHRMRLSSFRLSTSVLRVFSFSLEMGSTEADRDSVCGVRHHPESTGPPEGEISGHRVAAHGDRQARGNHRRSRSL
jgi:hypothetical protein